MTMAVFGEAAGETGGARGDIPLPPSSSSLVETAFAASASARSLGFVAAGFFEAIFRG
jgi:hypothetical protein